MNWEKKALSEIAKIKGGKRLPKGESLINSETQHPYIRARDIRNGKINFDDPKYLTEEVFQKIKRYIVEAGDVVITIVGANIGDIGFITEEFHGANLTENALKLTPKKEIILPEFLKYSLHSSRMKNYFQTIAAGTAQGKLGLYKVKKVKIQVPPLPTQRRIAAVLSAYDDLIENNLRRIRLLEEAAQLIYKEWFVYLRFPGHREVEVVEGVPEGWKKKDVGSLLKRVMGTKKLKKSEYLEAGNIPVIDQGSEFIGGYIDDEKYRIDVQRPIIIFGDHTRILKFIDFPFVRGADGTQLLLSKEEAMPQELFYYTLLNVNLSNYHYARHFKFLKEKEVLIPSLSVAKSFKETVYPMHEQIRTLRTQNQKLQEARDILLPRLMNGTIDVENITLEQAIPSLQSD